MAIVKQNLFRYSLEERSPPHSFACSFVGLLVSLRYGTPSGLSYPRMAQDGQNLPSLFLNAARNRSTQNSTPKYEFRKGVRHSGKMPLTTGLDQDDSGDYDPELGDVSSPCVMRAKRRQVTNFVKSTSEKLSNHLGLDVGQAEQRGSLANIDLLSEAAPDELATLSAPLDPREVTEFDAGLRFPFDFNAGTTELGLKPVESVPYQPRKRGRGGESKDLAGFSEATMAGPAANGLNAGSPDSDASLTAFIPHQHRKRARAELDRQFYTTLEASGHHFDSSDFDPGLGALVSCQSCKRARFIYHKLSDKTEGPAGPTETTVGYPVATGSNKGSFNMDSNPGASASPQINNRQGGTYDGQIDESQNYAWPRDITDVHPAVRSKVCKRCFVSPRLHEVLPEESRHMCTICGSLGDQGGFITETRKGRQNCQSCGWRTVDRFEEGEDCRLCTHCGASSIGKTTTGPSFPLGPVAHRTQLQPQGQPATPIRRQFAGIDGSPYQIHPNGSFRLGQSKEGKGEIIGANEPKEEVLGAQKVNDAPSGEIRTITTQLAHPIFFSYGVLEEETTACHWCNDLYYGLYGLGLVRTEVIDYGNGAPYVERANGHTNVGHPPSRMCTLCTMERFSIFQCSSHQIREIPPVNQDIFAQTSFMEYAQPGKANSAPFVWCSICVRPANHQCCTRPDIPTQPADLTATVEGKLGCGLFLCAPCAHHLSKYCNGELYQLIDFLRTCPHASLRADAEFLHPEGELSRQFKGLIDGYITTGEA